MAAARTSLELAKPVAGDTDLRGWEWYHLDSVAHSALLTLEHGPMALAVAFSPDGKLLASGGGSYYQQREKKPGTLKGLGQPARGELVFADERPAAVPS